MKFTTRQLAFCGVLAALYAAITIATAGIAYGPIQFRVAEALCILPFFAPITSVGLFVGCLIANLFSPITALDMVVGSAATLGACIWTSKLKNRWLAPLPPVIVNAVVIGAMIAWVETPTAFLQGFLLFGAQVGFGELVVMYLLGLPFLMFLQKNRTVERLLG